MPGAAVESAGFRRTGNWVAWLFVPFVAVAQAVTLVFPVPGARWLTYELLALALLAALTSPWLWRRRFELSRPFRLMLVSFTGYVAYALLSILVRPLPVILYKELEVEVPALYIVVPLATALAAMLAGTGLVLAAESTLRLRILAHGGGAAVLVAFLMWPYHSEDTFSWRLATGQGGAAVIHVMFLLIAALALACYVSGIRRRLFMAVAVGAAVGILATQSRGAIITVALWLLLVLLGRRMQAGGKARRFWPVAIAAVVVGVFAPLLPGMDRVLSLADPQRLTNMEVSLRLWAQNVWTMLFGTGPGSVWPWYYFEGGWPRIRITERPIPEGVLLDTPHSTPLAVLVETGIVGAGILACVFVALILLAWRVRETYPSLILGAAMLATLVAFLFDTYLLRNFGISMWWWAVAALLGTWRPVKSS